MQDRPIDDYTERFLAYVARAGPLSELVVNIYTAGLMELLKMDVELQNPKDKEISMSLARAYERHGWLWLTITGEQENIDGGVFLIAWRIFIIYVFTQCL